jgi:hypothetical protein
MNMEIAAPAARVPAQRKVFRWVPGSTRSTSVPAQNAPIGRASEEIKAVRPMSSAVRRGDELR